MLKKMQYLKRLLLAFFLILMFTFAVIPGCDGQTTTGAKGIQSKFFYTKNSDGSPGYTIIFSLSNYTDQPITATKVEVVDGSGSVKRSIDESDLRATSSGGIIEPGKSLNLSHKTSNSPTDIKKWTVKWQYLDSGGKLSTISGNYFDRH